MLIYIKNFDVNYDVLYEASILCVLLLKAFNKKIK